MASPKHTLPSSGISDVTKVSSRKRNEPEDEDETEEYNDEQSNTNKRARVSVSVASLPEPEHEPELIHALELLASFNTLDDDCLGNVLDFVGKKCYSVFGRVNKRCHEMFCSKGLPKETYIFAYGSLHLIQQRQEEDWYDDIAKGVLHYNRRDIFDWMLTDESYDGCERLKWLCFGAIEESRLDILREVFDRANEEQLFSLRDCDSNYDLCAMAALFGKLECLKFLRENECAWGELTWLEAKEGGHEHIFDYLRNNGYPTEWQVDSESESDGDGEYNSDN